VLPATVVPTNTPPVAVVLPDTGNGGPQGAGFGIALALLMLGGAALVTIAAGLRARREDA
jgi:hypothetical protein